MMMRSHLFIFLTVIPRVWGKPVTDQPTDQTRAGPVSEQMDVCLLSDPGALNVEVIYKDDEDNGALWMKSGPLSDCSSESESVQPNSCRVCKKNEQEVEATCRRIRSSYELRFEGDGKAFKGTCTSQVMTTPAPTTWSTAPPLQTEAPPPPGRDAGAIAGICAGVVLIVVAVGFAVVAVTKSEKTRSWWNNRRRRTRVPTMDLEMKERAPAANGHAPPPPVRGSESRDTGAGSVSEGQFSLSRGGGLGVSC